MSALDVLEIITAFGLIVCVWFVLLGWKLMTPSRARFGRRGSH